jgi:hypothetical protein
MTKAIINRDFSHYQTLQNKVNTLSLVRSQPIFTNPYSTSPNGQVDKSKVSILTLDLETRQRSSGHLEVISSAIFDGENCYTFYLTDFSTQEELLIATIKVLTESKYNNYNVYIHNFSGFDAQFLFKHIINLQTQGFEVTFLKRGDKFISVTLAKYEHKPYFNKEGELKSRKVATFKLVIYDSYLILTSSLKTLARAFKVVAKQDFDVTRNNIADLNDPAFRMELLEYNLHDCKVLYEVMLAFNQSFQELFKISIFTSPTLPSLAFKLYTEQFLKHKVEITWAEEYEDFKKAYIGGAVDVYKTYGKNLYYYDVNSLYPYVMKSNKYPIGDSSYFWGDIKQLKDIFGIVHCKVTAPNNLYTPILLTRRIGRTIAPLGSWEGWYCSEELKLAERYGYEIEVIEGHHWESMEYIFSEYVDTLYNYRLSFDKTDPRNMICKLLLNSLYGKFGMSPTVMEYSVLSKELGEEFFDDDDDDIQVIGDVLVKGVETTKNSLREYKYNEERRKHTNLLQISTPTAIFTTAYARMHMARFKMEYGNHLYYSDTDSLVLDTPLPDSMVGDQLGQVKLEYKIKEGIFLAPKTYSLILEDNDKVTKIKGSKMRNIPFDIFKDLLNKDSTLTLVQDKWFRDVQGGGIQILNSLYTLRATENKRLFVYNQDGVAVDTKPFNLT